MFRNKVVFGQSYKQVLSAFNGPLMLKYKLLLTIQPTVSRRLRLSLSWESLAHIPRSILDSCRRSDRKCDSRDGSAVWQDTATGRQRTRWVLEQRKLWLSLSKGWSWMSWLYKSCRMRERDERLYKRCKYIEDKIISTSAFLGKLNGSEILFVPPRFTVPHLYLNHYKGGSRSFLRQIKYSHLFTPIETVSVS